MTTYINNDPVDANWAQKFGFGHPRSTRGLQGICIHTTENQLGTKAENVAQYQINTQTGSYHVLVDNTENDNINSLRENTDDWLTWSAGTRGNQIAVHLSFVCYSAMSRDQWLGATRMLNEGADVVAYWCRKFDIPVEKIGPAELRLGRRGIFGHADVSGAWREVDHVDPGKNFPWDVFLQMVAQRLRAPEKKEMKEMKEMTALNRIVSLINPKKSFDLHTLVAIIDATCWETRVLVREIARKVGVDPDRVINDAITRDRGEGNK